jgi:hypothetical protein
MFEVYKPSLMSLPNFGNRSGGSITTMNFLEHARQIHFRERLPSPPASDLITIGREPMQCGQ